MVDSTKVCLLICFLCKGDMNVGRSESCLADGITLRRIPAADRLDWKEKAQNLLNPPQHRWFYLIAIMLGNHHQIHYDTATQIHLPFASSVFQLASFQIKIYMAFPGTWLRERILEKPPQIGGSVFS